MGCRQNPVRTGKSACYHPDRKGRNMHPKGMRSNQSGNISRLIFFSKPLWIMILFIIVSSCIALYAK